MVSVIYVNIGIFVLYEYIFRGDICDFGLNVLILFFFDIVVSFVLLFF